MANYLYTIGALAVVAGIFHTLYMLNYYKLSPEGMFAIFAGILFCALGKICSVLSEVNQNLKNIADKKQKSKEESKSEGN